MIRLGIVDFDSSHSIEFTQRLNQVGVDPDQFVDGAKVVMGWPGDSQMSPERIPGFTRQIEACGVELVDSSDKMLGNIDAVLVLSLCGQAHLERVRPFLEAGLPAYVDKPFACSLADAEEMVRLAEENTTLVYSSSALPFSAEVEQFRQREAELGALHGLVSYGPAKRAEGNPGLFHYGIHPTSVMFALMGTGCERVSSCVTQDVEVVTCQWRDRRLATLRGNRQGSTAYGFVAFCENGVVNQFVSARYAYRNLLRSIVRTFETGRPEIPNESALEIVRFVVAALESERRGGEFVGLDSVS